MSNISEKWAKEQLTEAGKPSRGKDPKIVQKVALHYANNFEKTVSNLDMQYAVFGQQIDELDEAYRGDDPARKNDHQILDIYKMYEEMNEHMSELNDLSYRVHKALKKAKV